MVDITVSEDLWASSMVQEGMIERWLVADGVRVVCGQPLLLISIEDALHEVMAPASGTLAIDAAANQVIEPGSVVGQLTA